MSETTPPYRDPARPVEERAGDLLARMSLDEKLAQLGACWGRAICDGDRLDESRAARFLEHGIGQITRLSGGAVLRPRELAGLANAIQRFLVERTRLGIPAVLHEESTAGLCVRDGSCFPQAIGLAATWDPPLVEEIARVIRAQLRAIGARHTLAPVLDVARDPRWGRMEETYGEDPYLAARLGVAYVRGIQGDDLTRGAVATGKHFVGYGASEGGLNWAPSNLPPRELRERLLPPFEAAIREAGLASVMNSYAEIDGVPCGASRELLEELLRDEMGFDGVVVADYFTVRTLADYHRVAADESEAAAQALAAGIDVELPATDCYGEPLRAALASGRARIEWVDRSVRRVLEQKLRLGLFERPYVDADAAPASFQTPEQRALARRAAERSMVLLTNRDGLLPLDPVPRRIALIGPAAASRRLLQGDYHYPTHLEVMYGPIPEDDREGAEGPAAVPAYAPGVAGDEPVDLRECFPPMVTLEAGLRARLGSDAELVVERGCDVLEPARDGFDSAVRAARDADVAVLCVGERSGLADHCTSGEFSDRASLGLPGVQEELVHAVLDTGTPTVVVLVSGRPLAVPAIAERADALLLAWPPGEEGGHALAALLLGDASPSGRLPVTVPRSVGQVPLDHRHKPSGARSQIKGSYVDLSNDPLFPFGHGLGYTRFEYRGLECTPRQLAPDGTLTVAVTVENAGARAGEEVVQLYVEDPVASVTRPVSQLAGFARVPLAPGEAARVVFELDAGQLAFHDRAMRYVVEPGELRVRVGASSADARAGATVEIVGDTRVLSRADVRPTAVTVTPV